MSNETKRELLLLLSLMCFTAGAVVFIYQIALHWEPFWLQLKRYWVHVALSMATGFIFLGVRREIPKKSRHSVPEKITPGKLYAGRILGQQKRK